MGQNMPHLKNPKEGESVVPRVSVDYFFMSERDEVAKRNPLGVLVNEGPGEKYVRASGRKGVGEDGVVDWLMKDISEESKAWGHQGGEGGKCIFKCDGEGSMAALRDAVSKFLGGR